MFVQPSSLIFLVIIGIWAAYFVQYWVRRREHLATIRSVDAFSETMRVLERRAPLPSVDHGGQAPRTYAVSPARAMRPQVTVKRAEAHVVPPVERVAAGSQVEVAALIAAQAAPNDAAMRPGRATRGIVVLIGLAGTLIFGLLALLGVLVSWSFVVPLVMAGVGFFWLRAGIQFELKAQRAARGRARRAAARTAAPTARASAPVAASATATASPERSVEVVASESILEPAQQSAPYDVASEFSEVTVAASVASAAPAVQETVEVQAVAQHEVARPEIDEDDIPLTWDPRPVPRPTYTMKARAAERPAPTMDVKPAAEAEHPAYDEVLQRRTAGA